MRGIVFWAGGKKGEERQTENQKKDLSPPMKKVRGFQSEESLNLAPGMGKKGLAFEGGKTFEGATMSSHKDKNTPKTAITESMKKEGVGGTSDESQRGKMASESTPKVLRAKGEAKTFKTKKKKAMAKTKRTKKFLYWTGGKVATETPAT